jgi:hypothetical protein
VVFHCCQPASIKFRVPELPIDVRYLLSNFVASLIGAWLGAVLAFRKLRRERAFERQLQWHEDMADNFYRIASAMNGVVKSSAHGPPNASAVADLINECDRLAVLGQKATLYATPESRHRVSEIMTQMRDAVAAVDRSSDETENLFVDVFSKLVRPVRDAGDVVAADVRRHLGLPSVQSASIAERLRRVFRRKFN